MFWHIPIYYISQLLVNDYFFVKISISLVYICIYLSSFEIYMLICQNQPFHSYETRDVNRNHLNLINSKLILDS